MRRYLALLLTLLLTLCVGCGSEPEIGSDPTSVSTPKATASPLDSTQAKFVNPAMWRVTDDAGHTMYLFSTVQFGDERNDIAVLKAAPVLDSCDALAVEYDAWTLQREYGSGLTAYQYFENGVIPLTDVIPEEQIARISEILEPYGIEELSGLNLYNAPYWTTVAEQAVMISSSRYLKGLNLFVDLTEYEPKGNMPGPVNQELFEVAMDNSEQFDDLIDLMIAYGMPANPYAMELGLVEYATQSQKRVISMVGVREPTLFQLQSKMPFAVAGARVDAILSRADTIDEDLKQFYSLWLSGDMDKFLSFLTEKEAQDAAIYPPEVQEKAAAYHATQTTGRVDAMLTAAQSYLESGDTVFFAVGTTHLVGEHGLLQLLTDAGYTVERYDYSV